MVTGERVSCVDSHDDILVGAEGSPFELSRSVGESNAGRSDVGEEEVDPDSRVDVLVAHISAAEAQRLMPFIDVRPGGEGNCEITVASEPANSALPTVPMGAIG